MKEVVKKNRKEKGATMIEYALLATLVAIVAIAGIRAVGTSISAKFSGVGSTLTNTN